MTDGKLKTGVSGLPILSRSKEKRSIGIVRTEVTRMANKGALEHYREGGIKKKRFVASFGPRTCEECSSLNGTIYNLDEGPEIPVHTMCRCTWVPMVELK